VLLFRDINHWNLAYGLRPLESSGAGGSFLADIQVFYKFHCSAYISRVEAKMPFTF